MRLLIDTHVLLWWDAQNPVLNESVKDLLADPENAVFVSAASVWEIATKARSGKLIFKGSVLKTISQNGFETLPISAADAEVAGSLDWEHRDPFDRMLVAQARNHRLTLISADAALRGRIEIAQIWAR